MKEAVTKVPTAQPCIIVRGSLDAIKEAVLIVEKQVIATISAKEVPLVLLSAFYAYNMHYTEGCTPSLKSFFSSIKSQQRGPDSLLFLPVLHKHIHF